jgi:L,D-transpeptidase catalytic domain
MRKWLVVIAFLATAFPALAFDPGAKTSSIAEADISKLKPGQFIWAPELAPAGPMTVLVNLQAQRAYVYRNGVRIAATTVSSGKPGHKTPTGVFTILQKDRRHRSSKYNNASMPFMQRLTWDGVALHAGGLPGFPSSHGCVHLPLVFSEKLFDVTPMGMTVVVTSDAPTPHTVIDPSALIPARTTGPNRSPAERLEAKEAFRWQPQLSPTGPVTIVMSSADQRVLVLRNGVIIGRARVFIPAGEVSGTHALQLTGFDKAGEAKWFYVAMPGHEDRQGKSIDISGVKTVRIPPAFYKAVHAILTPGATMMITDGSIVGGGEGEEMTVMTGQ